LFVYLVRSLQIDFVDFTSKKSPISSHFEMLVRAEFYAFPAFLMDARESRVNKESLKAKLLDLYVNPAYKENAEKTAALMRKEDCGDKLYSFILNK
jgi:hypothetical protein